MSEIVLEVKNLVYSYEGSRHLSERCSGHRSTAIDDLSFSVIRGERVAILGANGAGKSTLLQLLNGTLRPAGGEIFVEREPVKYSHAGLMKWRQKVGLVFQDPDDQLFASTMYQDVSFGPMNLGLNEELVRMRTDEALRMLGITNLADSPVHMLSGGQRKRAAIAGVMAMNPTILILDEPTAGMDAHGRHHLFEFLDHLQEKGMTVILAIHDTDLALAWADSVLVMNHGHLVRHGSPREILRDTSLLKEVHLKQPMVLECWEKCGFASAEHSEIPRTMDELASVITKGRSGIK